MPEDGGEPRTLELLLSEKSPEFGLPESGSCTGVGPETLELLLSETSPEFNMPEDGSCSGVESEPQVAGLLAVAVNG